MYLPMGSREKTMHMVSLGHVSLQNGSLKHGEGGELHRLVWKPLAPQTSLPMCLAADSSCLDRRTACPKLSTTRKWTK